MPTPTLCASCFSTTSNLYRRPQPLWPSTSPSTSRSVLSFEKRGGACHTQRSSVSFVNGSLTSILRFCVSACGGTLTCVGLATFGSPPNHFSTSFLVSATSMSPPIAIVAFEGAYHFLKKPWTSASVAPSRSSCLPITRCRYG